MDKRLIRLTWIFVIVIVAFFIWIKYELSISGSGDLQLNEYTDETKL